ncbi:uncharacterized protein LOC133805923 [Humulus lupulus]|uniref:uncharacterized protein LOC133805923 n=1 Tax=Humulus lupulus TaxID=3486 RepID=UPI002B401212|nr:uncharacterized protein LOC133805923 [Humulus lupulus]
MGSLTGYKYHDRCTQLRLIHLCFAFDLLLFSHGDYISILLMLRGLKIFSSSFGLLPSETKFAIYCSGMDDSEVRRVLRSLVSLEVIYLSGTLAFQFALKIFLLQNVGIMILPKKLLRDVEAICRAFLWKGMTYSSGPGLVAWNNVCLPKKVVGLGFRKVIYWNVVAMGKYIWAIASEKDNLWVRWIHSVYLNNLDWWEYKIPTDCSWYWKRLVAVKHPFKAKIDLNAFAATKYSIKIGHDLLFDHTIKVHWSNVV